MNYKYSDNPRIGDHIWYISDVSKFKRDYPTWTWKYNLLDTLTQIHDSLAVRERAAN